MNEINKLLIILRDNTKTDSTKTYIRGGLCYDVHKIDFLNDEERKSLSEEEKSVLRGERRSLLSEYIRQHKPKYAIPKNVEIIVLDMDEQAIIDGSDFGWDETSFGWLPGLWKPRLDWLNEHIELTK